MQYWTEPQDDFYSFELAKAARKLLTDVVSVKPGAQVVITADTASDPRVVRATAQAAYALDAIPTVIWYPTLPEPCSDPPPPVANALLKADLWIEFAVAYQLYSPAYEAAIKAGVPYICLTGMDVDMMVRTIGKVEIEPMRQMGTRLYELSQAAETLRVTNPSGTDLTMKIDKAGDPFWEPPPAEGGYPIMLPGQSGAAIIRESVEGVLVFDGALWPPAEVGILHNPVRLYIEKGIIQRIEGDHEAALFRRWVESFDDPLMKKVDHICYGFNPGVAKPTGRILEDERVFGCTQFGIGPAILGAPSHTDGVVLNSSVWADGTPLELEGRYVHPELTELCRQMGVPGY